jgi:ankyrin repeat protein
MSITIYTADGRTKQFKIDKLLRAAVTEWLGYPAVKFYTTENGEDETNTFSPDDVVFAIPYIPDKSLDADIIEASRTGKIDEVEDLISRCADVNARNEDMNTPLHFASGEGHITVIDMLLKNGADINITNNDMYSPLHFASYEEVIDMLLKNGADVDTTNNDVDTLMNDVIFQGHDTHV